MTTLKTPLYDLHVELGAKMVPFAGYEMPVRYGSDKEEHMHVRKHCGIFDVSHMGEVFFTGDRALNLIQKLITNDVSKIENGQALYSGILNDAGCFIDDAIVYRFTKQKFMICTNAGNRAKDTAHFIKVGQEFFPDVMIEDQGDQWAQIAVQGPKSDAVIAQMNPELGSLKAFRFIETTLKLNSEHTIQAMVASTGYTGEDGVEIYCKNEDAPALWNALLATKDVSVKASGLACRDTLRLEACYCLYGNDIDDTVTPLEAGMAWTVKLNKDQDFIGKSALVAQKEAGIPQRLRGITLNERGIARAGYKIFNEAHEEIGKITSGTYAPYLEKAIAMAYIKTGYKFGDTVFVQIRNKNIPATIHKLPFYKKGA